MKENHSERLKTLLRISIVAALYAVLTISLSFISYGEIQFRISEILLLLCFYRKDYSFSMVLGCFIANLFSPLGLYDCLFGTIATILSVLCIMKSKKLYLAIIYPIIFNGIIVGLELYLLLNLPLLVSCISVSIGEAVVMIFGLIIFSQLRKNKEFINIIKAKQNINIVLEEENDV